MLVFLTILTSGLQYLVQKLNYKRDLGRIEKIQRDARLAAWGAKLVPIDGQRKVRHGIHLTFHRLNLQPGQSQSWRYPFA